MYLPLILGVGCVVVAAAAAVFFSMPSRQPPHQQHQSRRRPANDYDDGFSSMYNNSKLRDSRVGDRCIYCLKEMDKGTMRFMHCRHAMHAQPCFAEYRRYSRQCPYCNQLVIRIDQPGENCAICCHAMEEHNMEYLECEHALHQSCLNDYKRNGFKNCPVCKRAL